jgi:hypothetical protein
MATRARPSKADAEEQRTEQQIVVRQVTHVQASWTERERGEEGDFTLQLILDQGAAEYVLHPDADDLELILSLLKMTDRASFDMERKVLIFGNIALT